MRRNVLQLFWFSAIVLFNYSNPSSFYSSAEDSKPVSPLKKTVLRKSGTPKSEAPYKVAKTTLGGQISEARAVAIVSARPEVKKFLQGIKNTKLKGVTSQVEFDRKEGADLVVHVYEFVPDDAETGHTATFNWYHVNSKTGKVSAEF